MGREGLACSRGKGGEKIGDGLGGEGLGAAGWGSWDVADGEGVQMGEGDVQMGEMGGEG